MSSCSHNLVWVKLWVTKSILLFNNKLTMKLTAKHITNLKPKDKTYKLSDGGGLSLLIKPNNSKYWQLRYRYLGKEKTFSIGVYPNISLKDARIEAQKARETLIKGSDPSQKRIKEKKQNIIKQNNNFEAIAREWFAIESKRWSENHKKRVINRLEKHLFKDIGYRPINEITALELLDVMKLIQGKGVIETSKRILQGISKIFQYAIIHEKAKYDITAGLSDGLQKSNKVEHFKHLTENQLSTFFIKLNNYHGEFLTRLAFKLIIHTFVRTCELIGAKWEEINLKKKQWTIPANRMKMNEGHIVPLSSQVILLLKEIHLISGHTQYLFPNSNNKSKTISNNTLLGVLKRIDYKGKTTVHGFRSTASTTLNEHGFRPDVIERQLAHAERNKVRASYNHAQYMKERIEMMQWWSEFLIDKGL